MHSTLLFHFVYQWLQMILLIKGQWASLLAGLRLRNTYRSSTSWFCLWFWCNCCNAVAMFLVNALMRGTQPLKMGHSRKHPYHPHGRNRKLTPLPPSDVLIHLLLSETIFSPLLLRTAEITSVGGVWIFSGTTQYSKWWTFRTRVPLITALARNMATAFWSQIMV